MTSGWHLLACESAAVDEFFAWARERFGDHVRALARVGSRARGDRDEDFAPFAPSAERWDGLRARERAVAQEIERGRVQYRRTLRAARCK
jgi:hypothetical protein